MPDGRQSVRCCVLMEIRQTKWAMVGIRRLSLPSSSSLKCKNNFQDEKTEYRRWRISSLSCTSDTRANSGSLSQIMKERTVKYPACNMSLAKAARFQRSSVFCGKPMQWPAIFRYSTFHLQTACGSRLERIQPIWHSVERPNIKSNCIHRHCRGLVQTFRIDVDGTQAMFLAKPGCSETSVVKKKDVEPPQEQTPRSRGRCRPSAFRREILLM